MVYSRGDDDDGRLPITEIRQGHFDRDFFYN